MNSEPTSEELAAITQLGRLQRLLEQGYTPAAAAAKLLEPETPEAYASRNRAAMEALEQRLLSSEYTARYTAIENERDPEKRERLRADLKRDNFAAIDMEAVHRNIAARNRQMRSEGILPKDTAS